MADFILVLFISLIMWISIEAQTYEIENKVVLQEVFSDGFLVVDRLKQCEKRLKKGNKEWKKH